ncbi:hypothetical protein J4462_00580 [Candidatus Pacearchaeota archaeon]|nr:hypothetical protein [Candidatus Pacearchaeota archaeon]
MQLSKLESYAYEELKKNKFEVFKIKDVCLLLKVSRTKAYNLVKSLKEKKAIENVGKGFLAFGGVDEFVIGSSIVSPSYVSFWSALNYYGFSDQMPKNILMVTTKHSPKVKNFNYVSLSKKRFFGYESIGKIVIADKEKTLIDSLLFPKYAGGIKEIMKCFSAALQEINIGRLTDYAFKVESKAVLRRLGFILEKNNYKGKLLEKLRKKTGEGYELLDPGLKRKNNLNETWLLDINL